MALEVVTAPATSALVALASLKDELGIADGDTSQDARLARIIARASAAAATFCGTAFGTGEYIETFQLSEQRRSLVLARRPIIAIEAITENDELLDDSAFIVDMPAGTLSRHLPADVPYGWRDPVFFHWWVSEVIIVHYHAGYLLPGDETVEGIEALPLDVEQAVIETCKAWYFAGGAWARDPYLRSESSEGVGSVSYGDPIQRNSSLPPLAQALLAPYAQVAF